MFPGLQLVFIVSLLARVVSAGIYGTYPVASSVLSAGRLNTVHWINDGTRPSVKEMGMVRLDLYVGEDFITTLADLVDPKSLSTDVWISPALQHNGSNYHMRFICQRPPLTIYTADFTITGMSSLSPLDVPAIDAHNNSNPNIVYVTPELTLVLPDTTVVSTLKPTPSTIQASPTPPSITKLEDDGLNVPGSRQRNGPAVFGLCKRPTVDLERLKFRFVFIFWPTLVGISMAL